jgi:hypothetical protein
VRARVLSIDLVRALLGVVVPLTALLNLISVATRAQPPQLYASVTSVKGKVALTKAGMSQSTPISIGQRLAPGDEIETLAGGRVILILSSDGSQVIIQPNSRVLIRDFTAAPSVRELVEILSGYIRVKIHHVGKRSNPYRVNTPVASIAVRGTEFDVRVDATTWETRVTVFEGLVEVTSQFNPQQKKLLSPGRSVIVRSSGDVGIFAPGAGGELNGLSNSALFYDTFVSYPVSTEIYRDNLSSPALTAPFERFLAIPDSHFDSLENPAFAGQFTKSEGRLYLLPSMNAGEILRFNQKTQYSSFSGAEQTTYFQPLGETRFVIGASVTAAHTYLDTNFNYDATGNEFLDSTFKNNLRTISWSVIGARRFGAGERTSLGVQFERITGGTDSQSNSPVILEDVQRYYSSKEETSLERTRVTAGVAHAFAKGRTLGAFYRYSRAASRAERMRTAPVTVGNVSTPFTLFIPFTETTPTTHTTSSETGFRWRSPLGRRLFYGIHGSIAYDRSLTGPQYDFLGNERGSRRVVLGAGVGYQLFRRATIAFDVARGNILRNYRRLESDGAALPIHHRETNRYLSFHIGGESDLGRHFFANASWHRARESTIVEFFQVQESINQQLFSDFYKNWNSIWNVGPGWRIRKNLSLQYILSRSSVAGINSHTFMLRFNFGSGQQQ